MTLMAVIFSLVGIAVWVAAGVLLYFRRKTLGKIEFMRSVQTSAASEVSSTAPGTHVEVKGTLRCEDPLKSEMADQTCAYYLSQVLREYEVTDRDSDGWSRTRRRSEVVASNERFAPFAVEDESGVVGVRGERAEVDALEVMNRFERDTGGAGSDALIPRDQRGLVAQIPNLFSLCDLQPHGDFLLVFPRARGLLRVDDGADLERLIGRDFTAHRSVVNIRDARLRRSPSYRDDRVEPEGAVEVVADLDDAQRR